MRLGEKRRRNYLILPERQITEEEIETQKLKNEWELKYIKKKGKQAQEIRLVEKVTEAQMKAVCGRFGTGRGEAQSSVGDS